MQKLLIILFLGFCVFKGYQQFGPVSKVEPLLAEPYVVVYGRSSCGWTQSLLKKLAKTEANVHYFVVDERPVADSLHSRMAQAGIDTKRYNLPVVDVNGALSVRPEFNDVITDYRAQL